jgi:hypothetical protein
LILLTLAISVETLNVQHEDLVPCRNFFWDGSPVILYNIAYEMSRNNMLQDWVFAFEKESLTQTCINASYYSAFDDPQTFIRIDLGRIAVRKSVCFTQGVLSENVSLTQVPYFDNAFLHISTARSSVNASHMHMKASFRVKIPWIFKVNVKSLETHVIDYLKRYFTLLAKTICV